MMECPTTGLSPQLRDAGEEGDVVLQTVRQLAYLGQADWAHTFSNVRGAAACVCHVFVTSDHLHI